MAYRNDKNRNPMCFDCQKSGIWMQPGPYPASGSRPYSPYGVPRSPMIGMPPNMRNPFMQYGYVADPYMMQMDLRSQEEVERQEQQDMEYWRQMYPEKVKRIQQYVMEQSDREDYDDSFIYDEYPDPMAVRNLIDQIQARMQEDKMFEGDWEQAEEIITVLLFEELYHRRCRKGRRKRRFY